MGDLRRQRNEKKFGRGIGRWSAMTASLALLLAPVLAAAAPVQSLPPQVRSYFDQARQDCREAGDRLRLGTDPALAETADFNGDGKPDYLVQFAALYCPSLGASEYCGSAGCQIAILVSEGDRLREAYGNNLQGFAITAPAAGRQSLAFAAHGTECGHKTGADTCFGILRWTPKGFQTSFTATEPAALRTVDAAQGDRPDLDPAYAWTVMAPKPGDKGAGLALTKGNAARPQVAVTCAENKPVLVVAFAPGPDAPPIGQHIMLEIGEPTPADAHADLILQPVPGRPAFMGPLSRRALAMMDETAGHDYAMLSASWTTQDRDFWTGMAPIALKRFDQTSNRVLKPCLSGLR